MLGHSSSSALARTSSEIELDHSLSSGDVKDGNRSRAKALQLLPALQQHLNVQPGSHLDDTLLAFAIEVILGAAWYTRKTAKAKWVVRGYIALNAALVIAVPVAIQFIPSTVAQITGVLTGILALQKTLSTWYASNLRYGAWYKAGSDLKSIYYGLASRWGGTNHADPDALRAELIAATNQARGIIEAEKLDFYQHLALPSFDVLDMLTFNRSAVAGLVTSLLPSQPARSIITVGTKAILAQAPDGQADTADDDASGPDADGGYESEMLAGDPEDPLEEQRISVASQQSVGALMSPFLLASATIVDPADVMGQALKIALDEADARVSRSSDRARVQQYLDVFNLHFYQPARKGAPPPGPPTKFCAAGVSWSILRAYCDKAGIPYSDNDDLAALQRAMPKVQSQMLTLSAMCQDILISAQHRRTWRAPDVAPLPGWLVLYNWSKPAGLVDTTTYRAQHIGFVRECVGQTLHTVEFNTTFENEAGKQGDGGAVSRKDHRHLLSVLGYVATYPEPVLV